MKKKWLLSLILAVTLAAGCGNNTTNTANQNEEIEEAAIETEVQESEMPEQVEPAETEQLIDVADTEGESAKASYQINMVNLKKDDLRDINYPQITNWSNEEKQEEWNAVFEQVAKTAVDGLGEKDEVTVKFNVQEQNDKFLSLTCESYYSYDGAAHPSASMVSYNINMQTGEKIKFANMADPKQTATNLFANKKCKVLTDTEVTVKDILEYNFIWMEPTEEALATSLSHFDSDFSEYGDNETMGYSYVHDGKVCLIFYVNHAMGDYVVVQLDA